MCGIAGIWVNRGDAIASEVELSRMLDHQRARGPDGEGRWFSDDRRLLLGHRRLAIIDLSPTGAQPMSYQNGALQITFNGEIYNFRELRSGLEARGHRFRSTSDTEVILAGYAEFGDEVVKQLRGMFAFALFDASRKRLLLARDAFGIKPLYYALTDGVLRFASQVKALLASGAVGRDRDPVGHTGFLLWGSVPEPYTLFRAVRQLEAGCYVAVDAQGMHPPVRYFEPRHSYGILGEVSAPALAVRQAVTDSVRHHLEADVPVGVFLSAGIDSNVIAALTRQVNPGTLRTVTLAFAEFRGTRFDESELAEQAARGIGSEHTTVTITRTEFERALPEMLDAMDQPTIDGVNSYFVSLAAKQAGLKVVLSGLGGDELFGGYGSFTRLPWLASALSFAPSAVPVALLARLVSHLAPPSRRAKLHALILQRSLAGAYLVQRGVYMPHELARNMPDLIREGLRDYDPQADAERHLPARGRFARVACLEQCMYMRNQLLRDTDWASMAHSVEVRVPLVDIGLHTRLASVAAAAFEPRAPKRLLAQAPANSLLPEVTARRKSGFRVPIQEWLTLARNMRESTWTKSWAHQVLEAFP